MLDPYRSVLSTKGALSFSSAALLARMPMSTIGLGIVLLIAARTGSYGLAGAVSAVFTLATGLSAPILGRLIDTLGQRRVLIPAFVGFAAGVLGLIVAVESDWPTPVPHVFAVVAGCLLPPVGACVRARWAYVLSGAPTLHTAYSLESVIDEAVFMAGPVLVTVLATQVHELAGLLAVLAIAGFGVWWLAGLRQTEPPVKQAHTADERPSQPMEWRWMAAMVVVAACLGSLFGATEVVTVAFAEERGHPGVTGLLLATWAGGSLIAGIITGLVKWKSSSLKRYRLGALGMATVMVPLPFIDGLWVLTGALFLAGFAISPTLVALFSLVEASVPGARLTEGITWISTGIGLGIAPGAAIAGWLIDEYGASPAYYVPVVSGIVAALVAWSTGPPALRTPDVT